MPHSLVASAARKLKSWRTSRFMNGAAPTVDALIASFPKCGRTWLRFALANYFAEAARLEAAPDLHSMFRIIPNFDPDPVRGDAGSAGSWVPAGITPRLPVVFLVRDPRDVVVSNYFHSTRHKNRFSGTIAEFIDDPDHGLRAYIRYLNSWTKFLGKTRHHITRYELMSADAGNEIRKILNFLSVPVDEEALSLALHSSTFESMQKHERAEGIPAHHYDRNDDESMRMRKGVAHGFRGYLTSEQIDQIDDRCRSELSVAGQLIVTEYSIGLNSACEEPGLSMVG